MKHDAKARPNRAIAELARPRLGQEGALPWMVGVARILVLAMGAGGIYLFGEVTIRTAGIRYFVAPWWIAGFLFALYGFNLFSGLLYLSTLRRVGSANRFATQTQVFLDFAVIAATISFTGDASSVFTFLLISCILEAGLLLGLSQGFVFATLSTGFVCVQAWQNPVPVPELRMWYGILVEGLSFFFTAFISGYWNQRIYRLHLFQREILDNMSSGFLITDRYGMVSAQNRAADQMLGIEAGTALGRPVWEVLQPESSGECPVLTALRLGRDFTSYEFYAMTGPGDRKLLGLTTNRLYDRRGRLAGIIASFTDLTEVDGMRQELHRQDRMAALGELAAGVAHEIRNPVAVIRGAVEELKSSLGTPALAEKLANMAMRESDHLNEIVSGFLDFARNPVTHVDTFDINELALDTAEGLRRTLDQLPDLHIEVSTAEQMCRVAGDRSRIKQVFTNIAMNGIEAMGKKGTLRVVVARAPGWVEAAFDDEGPGLEPDQVARIFEPFYTTKESGVGMGLAVSLRIVTAHDGTIRVAAREGGGARVVVRLPAAREEGYDRGGTA